MSDTAGEPPRWHNGGSIASPTAFEGVASEAGTVFRRSKTRILFVLKIEKQNAYSYSMAI
jgi:hypothetical protein